VGLVGAVSSATAAPIPCNINFNTTSGTAPTSGSFLYDEAAGSFSLFEVRWAGIIFDLSLAANNPYVAGSCDFGSSGGTGRDSFAFLSNPSCVTTSAPPFTWAVEDTSDSDGPSVQFSFYASDGTLSDNFVFWKRTVYSEYLGNGQGTFSIQAVPEPSTLVLMLGGGVLLAVHFRRGSLPRLIP
jgi:PEP-CTERM motif